MYFFQILGILESSLLISVQTFSIALIYGEGMLKYEKIIACYYLLIVTNSSEFPIHIFFI